MSEVEARQSEPANTADPRQGVAADSVLARAEAALDGLSSVDLAEHPVVYQRIHADLQGALDSIDDA